MNQKTYILCVLFMLFLSCNTHKKIGFEGSGSEPFWILEFKDGNFLFNSMGGEEIINLGYVEPIITETPTKKLEYKFDHATLTLEQTVSGDCIYDMSDVKLYSYTAILIFNNIPYKGCVNEVK